MKLETDVDRGKYLGQSRMDALHVKTSGPQTSVGQHRACYSKGEEKAQLKNASRPLLHKSCKSGVGTGKKHTSQPGRSTNSLHQRNDRLAA